MTTLWRKKPYVLYINIRNLKLLVLDLFRASSFGFRILHALKNIELKIETLRRAAYETQTYRRRVNSDKIYC